MAGGDAAAACPTEFGPKLSTYDSLSVGEDWSKLEKLVYDGKRLKWIGDLEGLRDFIECFVGLKGKWRSPGGSTKQFTTCDMDLNISWYAKKQNSLTFSGEDSDLLRDRLVQLCVDRELPCSKSLGLQNNDQSSCSTVSVDVVPPSCLSNNEGC